jgi:hypothetical protein
LSAFFIPALVIHRLTYFYSKANQKTIVTKRNILVGNRPP